MADTDRATGDQKRMAYLRSLKPGQETVPYTGAEQNEWSSLLSRPARVTVFCPLGFVSFSLPRRFTAVSDSG